MRKSERELRAIAYALTDEIETRALPLIKAGMPRPAAIARALEQMSGGAR